MRLQVRLLSTCPEHAEEQAAGQDRRYLLRVLLCSIAEMEYRSLRQIIQAQGYHGIPSTAAVDNQLLCHGRTHDFVALTAFCTR